jgi:hypothetical protein
VWGSTEAGRARAAFFDQDAMPAGAMEDENGGCGLPGALFSD